jgi:hypothetical protein
MSRVGLPQALVILAIVVAIVGATRLSHPSTRSTEDIRRPLVVWFAFLVFGMSVWLLTVYRVL